MKRVLLILLLVISGQISNRSFAQSQFSGWLATFNTFKTGKKTSIHSDIQLRSSDEFGKIQSLLLRAGLNVHLSKRLIVTTGYAYIQNRRVIGAVNGYTPEHRIWEQFLYNQKAGPVFMAHRFRIEQRFISKPVVVNGELATDGYGSANRFRYFTRNILPLRKQPVFEKGVFAVLQNEVFLNFGNKANVNGKTFDQNRLYLAAGYRFSKSFDMDAGYMNQYINGRANQFTNNHIIQLAGYIRL